MATPESIAASPSPVANGTAHVVFDDRTPGERIQDLRDRLFDAQSVVEMTSSALRRMDVEPTHAVSMAHESAARALALVARTLDEVCGDLEPLERIDSKAVRS